MRSTTGTSVNGNEASFVDAGFENIGLNRINQLESTRVVAARTNESTNLGSIDRSKSHQITIELDNGGDNFKNVLKSPMSFSFKDKLLIETPHVNFTISFLDLITSTDFCDDS